MLFISAFLIKKDKKIAAKNNRMVVIKAGLISWTITLLSIKDAPQTKPSKRIRMKLT
jgi:hypothetical protein